MNEFVKAYTEYAAEVTDAPLVFHEFMAYGILSAISGGNVYLPSQDSGLKPNLYMVLLAPSSYYRKSTSLMLGVNLLRKFDEGKILPNEFSMEALATRLAKKPDGVFYYNEFKSLLGLLRRDYMAGALAFLCSLYDNFGGWIKETKSEGEIKLGPTFVNIWGATTEEWFIKEVTGDDVSSGFLARFLFVYGGKKTKRLPFPPGIDREKQEKLVKWMKEIATVRGEMILLQEAKDLYSEYDQKTELRALNCKHDYSCIYTRLSDYVKKFALLNAISNMRGTVDGNDMKEAIRMISWATSNIEDIVENKLDISKFATQRKKTKKIIESRGEAGILRGDLLRFLGIKAKELDEILKVLEDMEEIKTVNEKTSTKPREIYVSI